MAQMESNDFLRFSAYSIKDLITRKLSEDKNFTDQIYEGSNLAILIDIVSYMYQCLIYNLNTAAAESMFSDTQIYENISRLCKFIGYHPMAFKPATLNMYVHNNSEISNCVIYPCTAVDTGLYDTNSNKIYFSTIFNQNTNAERDSGLMINEASKTNVMLVNGRWKHYSTVFTAAGIDYETFVLDGIKSDSVEQKYVANGGIQVFVIPNGMRIEDASNYSTMWYSDPNEIFIQAYDSNSDGPSFSKLYNSDDHVYTSYLNENKVFEIKFGNGITGKRLDPGDQIHVMYLESNGPDGYVDIEQLPLQLSGKVLIHNPSFFGVSNELYNAIFGPTIQSNNIADADNVEVELDPASLGHPFVEENVEDIRNNAPEWFKTGNRLITKRDYEFFLKANNSLQAFPAQVIDVVCMNNWDYLATFYRWLYNLGLNPVEEVFNSTLYNEKDGTERTKNPYRYLTKVRLMQLGYQYVDSADANNIYLWIATNGPSDMKVFKDHLDKINNIKTMTSETYPLNPIDVYFDISFTPSQLFYDNLVENGGNSSFDYKNSYLEITISDNTIFSNVAITSKVESIIRNAFDVQHCTLGQIVDYSVMLDQIYQINGVTRVRTVYYPDDYLENEDFVKYKTRSCDGIAFASWSNIPTLVDIGDDLQINNTTRSLEKFQFPRLAAGIDIRQKIKVIRKSMNTVNPVKF